MENSIPVNGFVVSTKIYELDNPKVLVHGYFFSTKYISQTLMTDKRYFHNGHFKDELKEQIITDMYQCLEDNYIEYLMMYPNIDKHALFYEVFESSYL